MKVSQLTVLLNGVHAADVTRTRAGSIRLTMTGAATTPLSLSLPRNAGSLAGDLVQTYLWSLLPESPAALEAVQRLYGADVRDPLSLLAAIGLDCAGAVQFCHPDQVQAVLSRAGELIPVNEVDIEARLAEMAMDEKTSWTMPGEHWSLGGVQQKFNLRRQDSSWFEAKGAEPTTHIVKPGVRGLKAQALIEHVSMAAARQLGLNCASTEYATFKSQNAIVIKRFDRVATPDGVVTRRHQQDVCQALGRSEKYEQYGGPSAKDIVKLLRDASPTAARGRENVSAFVDGLVFNALIGAPDAHGRNYAVLLAGNDIHLAPLYDVASGLAYGPLSGANHASSMSIGGAFDLDGIGLTEWSDFAKDVDLDPAFVMGRVHSIGAQVPEAFDAILAGIDDWSGAAKEVRERLIPALRAHVAKMLQ